MDQLASLQQQLRELTYDFQRSVRSLSALVITNESNVDGLEHDMEQLQTQLHDLDKKLAVLSNTLTLAPRAGGDSDAIYRRIEEVVRDFRASLDAANTQIQNVNVAVQLVKQRVDDMQPGGRRDPTPLGVPVGHPLPSTNPPGPGVGAITRDIIQKWSPHLTALIALLLAWIQQCNPPIVEHTDTGHTRVVFPVNDQVSTMSHPTPTRTTPTVVPSDN